MTTVFVLVIVALLAVIYRLVWVNQQRAARAERWCNEIGHDVSRVDGDVSRCLRCGEPV